MTNKQLKNLKDTLWTTADQLRANSGLKSTEYAEPILGLIFLRFADVKYSLSVVCSSQLSYWPIFSFHIFFRYILSCTL